MNFLTEDLLEHSLGFGFSATNNEAEYEVLLASLWLVKQMGATSVKVFSDSQFTVCQVQ